MAFEYCLASGLVLFIMGIAFLVTRILYIKKGDIALATLFKREEKLDNDDNIYYVPYFKFTTRSNKEIIYKHRSTDWKYRWTIGEKVKVIYREGLSDDHEILMLSFYDAFGLSASLLTAGSFLLLIAGGIYWNASIKTLCYLLPSIVLILSAFYLWSNWFFKRLH